MSLLNNHLKKTSQIYELMSPMYIYNGNGYINSIYTDYNSRDNNYMFSYDNMFFDIMSNHQIPYFDIPNDGNYGYDGINKMKKRIDDMHDVYFYINKREDTQFSMEIYDYIVEVSDKKYSIEDFLVYYKE